MLVHHTDCGMLTFTDADLKEQILEEIGLKPPFSLKAFADVEADLRQSMARIKASPYVPYTDQVRGFVYDVKTGRLNEII